MRKFRFVAACLTFFFAFFGLTHCDPGFRFIVCRAFVKRCLYYLCSSFCFSRFIILFRRFAVFCCTSLLLLLRICQIYCIEFVNLLLFSYVSLVCFVSRAHFKFSCSILLAATLRFLFSIRLYSRSGVFRCFHASIALSWYTFWG